MSISRHRIMSRHQESNTLLIFPVHVLMCCFLSFVRHQNYQRHNSDGDALITSALLETIKVLRPCLNVQIESVHRICLMTDSVDRSCFGS